MEVPILTVFIYASITAVATGLGALPLLAVRRVPPSWLGLGNAAAGGLMLAASFNLVYEAVDYGTPRTLVGVVLGLAFIVASRRWLAQKDVPSVGQLVGADALKALLIVGVMTVHSAAEGIGVGVSFGGGETFGAFISVAIALHNVPEGLAISLVLVPKGVSVWHAAGWSIFSSLPQPLMALPAFLFVEAFEPVLPVGLGFAAGAMIWMVFSELIPEALEDATPGSIAVTTTLSIVAMVAFQVWMGG